MGYVRHFMGVRHNPRCAIFQEPPGLRDMTDCNCGAIQPLPGRESRPTVADEKITYFELTVAGTSRELYVVAAESEEEARAKFARGQVGKALLTEIDNAEITSAVQKVF